MRCRELGHLFCIYQHSLSKTLTDVVGTDMEILSSKRSPPRCFRSGFAAHLSRDIRAGRRLALASEGAAFIPACGARQIARMADSRQRAPGRATVIYRAASRRAAGAAGATASGTRSWEDKLSTRRAERRVTSFTVAAGRGFRQTSRHDLIRKKGMRQAPLRI